MAQSLAHTAQDLDTASATAKGQPGADARRLAAALKTIAAGPPALRQRAADALVPPLQVLLTQIRAVLQPTAITRATLPPELVRDWTTPDGLARVQVFPSGDSNDNRVLARFTKAVRALAPDATGTPITIQEAGRTIYTAFIQAGVLSFVAIMMLLFAVLRRAGDVARTGAPILLTGLLTLATCVLVGQPLNFANIIAFPAAARHRAWRSTSTSCWPGEAERPTCCAPAWRGRCCSARSPPAGRSAA